MTGFVLKMCHSIHNRLEGVVSTAKRGLNIVILLLMGLLTGLVLAEVLVRMAIPSFSNVTRLYRLAESERGKFARYDGVLGWDGLENAQDTFEWVDTRHHVRQNRYGYRGPEYDYERSGKRRILFLGDSFVWGFGVENEEIFTHILGKKLQSTAEVINMGVSGYGTDQAYLLWKQKARKWNPDDVVLMVTIFTDFWDNVEAIRYGYPKPFFRLNRSGDVTLFNVPVPSRAGEWRDPDGEVISDGIGWMNYISSHSVFANVLKTAAIRNTTMRHYLEERDMVISRLPGFNWEYPLYLKQPGEIETNTWNLLFALINKLDDDVTAAGAQLSVALIPSIVQVYPELWEKFARNAPAGEMELDPEAPNRRIMDWCMKAGIEVVDLMPALKEAGRNNPYLYFPVNGHWTSEGHQIVAETLLPFLADGTTP